MKFVSALVGLAALGGVALSTSAASAQPIEVPVSSGGINVPSGYICNEWGHCWHRHYWGGGGYYHPHYWGGGGYGWHNHWDGGWRWRRWHAWHQWHHWHQW